MLNLISSLIRDVRIMPLTRVHRWIHSLHVPGMILTLIAHCLRVHKYLYQINEHSTQKIFLLTIPEHPFGNKLCMMYFVNYIP